MGPLEIAFGLYPFMMALLFIGGLLWFFFSSDFSPIVPIIMVSIGFMVMFFILPLEFQTDSAMSFSPPPPTLDWSWIYPVLSWAWWGLQVIGYASLVYLLPRWSSRLVTWAVSPPPRWLCRWLDRPLPPRPFHPVVRSCDVPPVTVLPEPWVWVMEDIDRSLSTVDALLHRHETVHVELPLRLVK